MEIPKSFFTYRGYIQKLIMKLAIKIIFISALFNVFPLCSMDHVDSAGKVVNYENTLLETPFAMPYCFKPLDVDLEQRDPCLFAYNNFVRDMQGFRATYKGREYAGRCLFAAVYYKNISVLRFYVKAARGGLYLSDIKEVKEFAYDRLLAEGYEEMKLNKQVVDLLMLMERYNPTKPSTQNSGSAQRVVSSAEQAACAADLNTDSESSAVKGSSSKTPLSKEGEQVRKTAENVVSETVIKRIRRLLGL